MTALYSAIYRAALVTAVPDRVPFITGLVARQLFHDSKSGEKNISIVENSC